MSTSKKSATEVRRSRLRGHIRAAAQTKSTKAEAQYEAPSTHTGQRCAGCTMFRGPAIRATGTCTAVEGPIDPNGWCSFWERLSGP